MFPVDQGLRLDFPHQSDLPPGLMPARGAFCVRVNLGKNSEPAYLEETINWPSVTSRWGRFHMFIRVDDDVNGAGSMTLILPEMGRVVSDRRVEGTNVMFRFGDVGQKSGANIAGTLYFDSLLIDEDRLYDDPSPLNGDLSGGSLFLVQSGFAFLGPGELEHITVIDGGSGDCRVRVYDTDFPTRLPAGGLRYDLLVPSAGATVQTTSRRVPFRQGAYVELSGTNPQAIVRLGKVASDR